MILKSMSRKGSGEVHFAQLYDYIHRDHVPGYEVWHNFMRREPGRDQVIGDFVRNGRGLRSSFRHNILYHKIISLARGDRAQGQGQVEALHDLAQRYLEERAPGQLAYDKDHSVQTHLLTSVNEVGSLSHQAKSEIAPPGFFLTHSDPELKPQLVNGSTLPFHQSQLNCSHEH